MAIPPPLPDRQYTGQSPKNRAAGTGVLIGCGIGCGAVIGLLLIIIGFGGWWFFSSEVQVPTDRILNTGSCAAFRLEDISRNQEAMQLVSDVLKEVQRINQEGSSGHLPEFMEKYKRFYESRQDPSQFIKWLSPKEATASISTDEAGNPVFIIAANFGTGTRMVKLVLNGIFENDARLKENKISTEHGDLFIFNRNNGWNNNKPEQSALGFYKGTFIFSNDSQSAISALGHLAEESSSGKLNKELSGPYNRLRQKKYLAYGVMDGAFFKNPDFGIGPFKTELGSEIKKAEIYVDKLSGENGILNLDIDWNNIESAAEANEEIGKLKPEWISRAEQIGFNMDIINSLEGEKLDIKFHVNNLKDSLVYLIQNQN